MTLDALCAAAMPKKKNEICQDQEMPSDSESNTDNTPSEPVEANMQQNEEQEVEEEETENLQGENEEENNNPCYYDDYELFDSVFSDSTFLLAHFPEWYLKDKLKYSEGGGSASMVHNCLLYPCTVPKICKFHQRLTMLNMSDRTAPWTGCINTGPIKQIIESRSTFASRRFICGKDSLLVHFLAAFQAILLDENQDLDSNQEIRLIQQAQCPVILVGDLDTRKFSCGISLLESALVHPWEAFEYSSSFCIACEIARNADLARTQICPDTDVAGKQM